MSDATAAGAAGPAPPPPRELAVLLGGVALVVAWSAWQPREWGTWCLEIAPVLIGGAVLLATRRIFPLSPLLLRLLCLHGVILAVGAHYTYARVPVGDWLRDAMDLSRNHYDRLGHFAQGFVPAILVRELLLRRSPLARGLWTAGLITCVCLAFSALYELLEWWTALIGGDSAESFLGTQGDEWDTQWDMALALCGAILAQTLLGRAHDRSMARVPGATERKGR